MANEGAAGALAAALVAALREVPGLSAVFDGPPAQAGDAHAVVEMGPEIEWGHKSGAGAELRFALLIRCGGERPGRARELMEAARARLDALGREIGPWRLVTLVRVRSRTLREPGPRWTAMIDYRARLLAA